jgi:hypothetical protein
MQSNPQPAAPASQEARKPQQTQKNNERTRVGMAQPGKRALQRAVAGTMLQHHSCIRRVPSGIAMSSNLSAFLVKFAMVLAKSGNSGVTIR